MNFDDLIQAFNELKQKFRDHQHTGTDSSVLSGSPTTLTGDVTGTGTGTIATTIAAGAVTESKIGLSDVTTDNVTSTAHGFAPKSPADATKYLDGAATPAWKQVQDSDLSLSDITTNNASTSNHGFLKKLSNVVTQYMDGTGNYSVPPSSVRIDTSTSTTTVSFTGQGTTETDLYSTTVPANTLGTTGAVQMRLEFSCAFDNVDTLTLKLYYGSGNLVVTISPPSGATLEMRGVIDAVLFASGATNSQYMSFSLHGAQNAVKLHNVGADIVNNTSRGSGFTTDSTSSQTFKLTATWSAGGSASATISVYNALVHKII